MSPMWKMTLSFLNPIERVQEISLTVRHWRTVQRLARHHAGRTFPWHDVVKGINILIFGDAIATRLHRRFSSHHLSPVTGDIAAKVEAAIDWESARFDKPSKPLTAYQTWKRYYPQVDMESTLRELGLWEGDFEII